MPRDINTLTVAGLELTTFWWSSDHESCAFPLDHACLLVYLSLVNYKRCAACLHCALFLISFPQVCKNLLLCCIQQERITWFTTYYTRISKWWTFFVLFCFVCLFFNLLLMFFFFVCLFVFFFFVFCFLFFCFCFLPCL